MSNGLNFYFNDLYPNNGINNTRTETIPEAEDRQVLGEDEKATNNATVTPHKRKSIFLALALFLIIAVVLGIFK